MFGAQAVVQVSDALAKLIEQPGGLKPMLAVESRRLCSTHASNIRRIGLILKMSERSRMFGGSWNAGRIGKV